ncbi:MAG: ABC transporter ATP-binding protein [Thermotogae bacterium]|jgi:peptide/nickel transport system ATP-binding protein|nr:ABC transporter ATP-binding protein [Thermotogota bacterium]MCL5033200.1 ABC transporter ATP-binding protein [Thermotogota bacterium]
MQVKKATNTKSVIEVKNLMKEFRIGSLGRTRVVHAINGIDFEIGEKEVLGLVGESGSGKTTVARVIVRLYEPTSGKILLNGEETPLRMKHKALVSYRKHVQMIFQDPFSSLNPLHSVGYGLTRPLKIHKIVEKDKIKSKVLETLEEAGLIPPQQIYDKFPYELSGGQRQRVGIARAIAVQPQLILADEPTSMLDVSIRLDIMNQMLELKEKEGVSYLFITHDLAGAHYMSDRIAIMYAGHLVEIGLSDDVINDPKHPYTQLLKRAAPKPESGLEPEKVDVGGEVPDLTNLPPGCPFEPRCPFAKPECKERVPDMVKIDDGHFTRCILYKNRTEQNEIKKV